MRVRAPAQKAQGLGDVMIRRAKSAKRAAFIAGFEE
jgi:hypothetical protein